MIKADNRDKELVVNILSEAFDTNNSVNYVVKQDNRRKQRIRSLMEYSFYKSLLFGNVFLSNDRKACALIILPDKKKFSLKSIWLDLQLAFSAIGLTRIPKITKREAKINAYHPKEPFCHLWFIGVEPKSQNKGIGSVLLEEIINETQQLRRPIYLETSRLENIKFYKKKGFLVYGELDFGYKFFFIKRDFIK